VNVNAGQQILAGFLIIDLHLFLLKGNSGIIPKSIQNSLPEF